jgi:hypothetical protein
MQMVWPVKSGVRQLGIIVVLMLKVLPIGFNADGG